MKVTMTVTISIDFEVDDEMQKEIQEWMDLENLPKEIDVRDWAADQVSDNLEDLMANYGFSIDGHNISVKPD